MGHVSNGCHRTWTGDCTNCFIRVTLHITSGTLSVMVAMEPAFLGSLYRQVVALSRSLCTVSGPVQLGPGAVIIVKRWPLETVFVVQLLHVLRPPLFFFVLWLHFTSVYRIYQTETKEPKRVKPGNTAMIHSRAVLFAHTASNQKTKCDQGYYERLCPYNCTNKGHTNTLYKQ